MNFEKEYVSNLSKILLTFYENLESIAYDKHEITTADLIDFSDVYKRKIIERANGIIASFMEAYQTLIDQYENLILSKYRVPSKIERNKIDEAILKLNTKFDRLLRIIRAKVIVLLEDIEDEKIEFQNIQMLHEIKKITFKEIMDSLISGKYLFGLDK